MPVFELKNVCYKYDKYDKTVNQTLDSVSFKIENGDVVALIGKSGSGKSTLVSHLNGILKADSGDILYHGSSIYDKNFDLTHLRFNCGVAFQYPDYQLFADTVLEDVSFGPLKKGLSVEDAKKKSLEALRILGIEKLKDMVPFNLSGGEKRKVAFAGIFAMEPEILILDEPDAGLDSMSKRHMYEFILNLNKKNKTTVIFITHDLDDVMEYANNVILINDGKIESSGTPYDVLSDDAMMKRCGLVKPHSLKLIDEIIKAKGIDIKLDNYKYNEILKFMIKCCK